MSESPHPTVLPAKFEDADLDDLVILIADMLQRLISHNDQIPLSPESLTRFHSRSPPAITVLEYLRRIVKYTNVERTCLLITLYYIDQICARRARFTISSLTVHRFIVASVAVASKALCDVFCTNTHYAKVGGLRVAELNLLEKEFLEAIDWRLTCTVELLQEYYVSLARSASGFRIADAAASSASGSDISRSASASPVAVDPPAEPPPLEPAGVLMSKAAVLAAPAPTLEQNMAFADLTQARAEKRPGADAPEGDVPRPVKRKLE